MSDRGTSEKTEQPTAKRLRDARKKGQVSRSQDMVITASLLALLAYLWFGWQEILSRIISLFSLVTNETEKDFKSSILPIVYEVFYQAALITLPILAITIIIGLLANILQVGAIFSFEIIKPKLERLDPFKGLQRIFSIRQFFEIGKTLLKIIIISTVIFFLIHRSLNDYINIPVCGFFCLKQLTIYILGVLFLYSALVFVVISIIDFLYQKRAYIKGLMMTKVEITREYKEMEGDPLIKRRRRQMAQELAMEDSLSAARQATAIIVNPTHLAVAIFYLAEKVPLPIVTAKGQNRNAHSIIAEAEGSGVPIFRNVSLARTLFADAELFEPIPDDMFEAVAEVLSWVVKNKDGLYSGPLSHGIIDMDST